MSDPAAEGQQIQRRTNGRTKKTDVPRDRIAYTGPHPESDALLGMIYEATTRAQPPEETLTRATEASGELARLSILRSLSPPWAIASEQLVDSLSDDQARAVLCALVNVFVQARQAPQKGPR